MTLPTSDRPLERLAELLRRRNEIDRLLSQLIGRPASPGHLGEFIAAEIFDVALHPSASAKASDGIFRSGVLAGRSVNIKLYQNRTSLLDLVASSDPQDHPNFYLVLTGPKGGASSSRGTVLTFSIDSVFLFDSHDLVREQISRGVKLGVASSIVNSSWQAGMIYPATNNSQLVPSAFQREMLSLFASNT